MRRRFSAWLGPDFAPFVADLALIAGARPDPGARGEGLALRRDLARGVSAAGLLPRSRLFQVRPVLIAHRLQAVDQQSGRQAENSRRNKGRGVVEVEYGIQADYSLSGMGHHLR